MHRLAVALKGFTFYTCQLPSWNSSQPFLTIYFICLQKLFKYSKLFFLVGLGNSSGSAY